VADEITWNKIKSTGIPIGLLAALVFSALPLVDWFTDYHAAFITIAEADSKIDRHLQDLERKVDQNKSAVTDLQHELRIRMSMARVEALEDRLYVLNRDGANDDLIHEVENDLSHAQIYTDCLVEARPNCQHLEPGRTR